MRFLALLLVVVLIGAGLWYIIAKVPRSPESTQTVKTPTGKYEVLVTKTSAGQNSASTLPAGFPDGIPVERGNITESYKSVYSGKGVTQYTVSYSSHQTREALWDMYSKYMKGVGYGIEDTSSRSSGLISGTLANDTLTAVISVHSGMTLVQLSLLDRGT